MNQRLLLITGELSLLPGFAGFICNYFYLGNNSVLAFVAGILFGLSLVMNLAYLIKRRNQHPYKMNVK